MGEVTEDSKPKYGLAIFWGCAFFAGMFGVPIIGRYLEWPQTAIMVGMLLAMSLLVPMILAIAKQGAKDGSVTPAMKAYNRRVLIWSFAYGIALFGAITIYNEYTPTGLTLWIIAVFPAIPILWSIWAMGRYLAEEKDEYIRARQVQNAVFATGLLLTLATIWGFLEMFGVAPHVPSWAAVPVWAIGLAIGQLTGKLRSA